MICTRNERVQTRERWAVTVKMSSARKPQFDLVAALRKCRLTRLDAVAVVSTRLPRSLGVLACMRLGLDLDRLRHARPLLVRLDDLRGRVVTTISASSR